MGCVVSENNGDSGDSGNSGGDGDMNTTTTTRGLIDTEHGRLRDEKLRNIRNAGNGNILPSLRNKKRTNKYSDNRKKSRSLNAGLANGKLLQFPTRGKQEITNQ